MVYSRDVIVTDPVSFLELFPILCGKSFFDGVTDGVFYFYESEKLMDYLNSKVLHHWPLHVYYFILFQFQFNVLF
jgi:hypothetical protein